MNKFLIVLITFIILGQISMGYADNRGKNMDINADKLEKATFAGGCFWCMQPAFDKLKGVISTTVGYTGGSEENPTYEGVSSGKIGHAEAIEIIYDPTQITIQSY